MVVIPVEQVQDVPAGLDAPAEGKRMFGNVGKPVVPLQIPAAGPCAVHDCVVVINRLNHGNRRHPVALQIGVGCIAYQITVEMGDVAFPEALRGEAEFRIDLTRPPPQFRKQSLIAFHIPRIASGFPGTCRSEIQIGSAVIAGIQIYRAETGFRHLHHHVAQRLTPELARIGDSVFRLLSGGCGPLDHLSVIVAYQILFRVRGSPVTGAGVAPADALQVAHGSDPVLLQELHHGFIRRGERKAVGIQRMECLIVEPPVSDPCAKVISGEILTQLFQFFPLAFRLRDTELKPFIDLLEPAGSASAGDFGTLGTPVLPQRPVAVNHAGVIPVSLKSAKSGPVGDSPLLRHLPHVVRNIENSPSDSVFL